MTTYQIYELSARAVMSYATEQDGVYTFALNRSATEHCKVPGAKHEQDSCAMFHQLMYQLHGEGWRERSDEKVTALSDVLFYMDFAGIFDRRGTGRTQQARREKARDMFRPKKSFEYCFAAFLMTVVSACPVHSFSVTSTFPDSAIIFPSSSTINAPKG